MSEDFDEGTTLILAEIAEMLAEMRARPGPVEAPVPRSAADLSDVEKYTLDPDAIAGACCKDRRFAVMIDRAIRDVLRVRSDRL